MRAALILAATLAATPALAHPGHEGFGLLAGLAHPFAGWDHLAAMVAVGLVAGLLGGAASWALPGAFLGGMLAGGVLGMGGTPLPFVEAGILASVAVLGLLLAAWTRPPPAPLLPLVAAFGLLHGHAHGAEMQGGDAVGYAFGFLLATALLHAAGLLLGQQGRLLQGLRLPLRLAGAALAMIAGGGLLLG